MNTCSCNEIFLRIFSVVPANTKIYTERQRDCCCFRCCRKDRKFEEKISVKLSLRRCWGLLLFAVVLILLFWCTLPSKAWWLPIHASHRTHIEIFFSLFFIELNHCKQCNNPVWIFFKCKVTRIEVIVKYVYGKQKFCNSFNSCCIYSLSIKLWKIFDLTLEPVVKQKTIA